MKRGEAKTVERFEKVPTEPIDYLRSAVYTSRRWWWLPIVFSIIELIRSSAFSIVMFAMLALFGWISISNIGLVDPLSPLVVIFLAAALACGFTLSSLFGAVTWSACWGTFARVVRGEEVHPIDDAAEHMVDAAIARIGVSIARWMGTFVFATGVLTVVIWYRTVEPVGLIEMLWFAVPMTFGLITCSFVGLIVGLAGAQVPVIRFSDHVTWPQALIGAISHTTRNLELIYRVFVTSILIVFPALVFLYFATFVQTIAVEAPQLMGIAATIRSLSNLIFSVSFSLAAFYFHAASFWVYAVKKGAIEALPIRNPSQTILAAAKAASDDIEEDTLDLASLLPNTYEHIYTVGEIVGSNAAPPGSDSSEE